MHRLSDDALGNMKQLNNQGGSYKKIMKDFVPLYNANDVLKNIPRYFKQY